MPVLSQGDDAYSNEHTAFVTLSSGTLGVDLSQFLTDIPESSGVLSAANDERFAVDRDRSLTIQASFDDGSYELWANTPDTGSGLHQEFLSVTAGVLLVQWPGTTGVTASAASLTLPNPPGGTPVLYTITWSIRDNPDTTGDTDALLHELVARNGDQTTRSVFSTAPRSVGDSTASETTIGDAGVSLQMVAFDHAALPSGLLHARGSYGSPSTPGLVAPINSPTLHVDTGTSDAGQHFGHQAMMATRHHTTAIRRLFSPIVNELFVSTPDVVDGNWSTLTRKLTLEAPQSPGHNMLLGWLRYRKVPALADQLRCGIRVRSYVTSGSAVPVTVRAWVFDHSTPSRGRWAYAGATITVDSATTSQWIHVTLPVIVDERGFTYFCVSVAFDIEGISGNDDNARVQILGMYAFPRTTEDVPGGLPDGESWQ